MKMITAIIDPDKLENHSELALSSMYNHILISMARILCSMPSYILQRNRSLNMDKFFNFFFVRSKRTIQLLPYSIKITVLLFASGLAGPTLFAEDMPNERFAVASDKIDMQALDGRWIGEYKSEETDRQGYISFSLSAEKNRAIGGVLMVSGRKQKVGKPGSSLRRRSGGEKRKPLTITFVEISDGKVAGKLTPFYDSSLKSQVHTVFEGQLYGGEMLEGTFSSLVKNTGSSYSGTWRVFYTGPND